jgi:hypothetical protein
MNEFWHWLSSFCVTAAVLCRSWGRENLRQRHPKETPTKGNEYRTTEKNNIVSVIRFRRLVLDQVNAEGRDGRARHWTKDRNQGITPIRLPFSSDGQNEVSQPGA